MNTQKKITGILCFLQCFVLTVLAESLPSDILLLKQIMKKKTFRITTYLIH